MVENSRTDRAFLLALADRHQRASLEEAEEDDRLVFEHAGGLSEMQQRLRAKTNDPMWSRNVFVVFDSDALLPGEPSPQASAMEEECLASSVEFHRLRRRFAESYLPLPALEAWARGKAHRRPRVRAFGRMTAEQRYHFNMKKGFDGDRGHLFELAKQAHGTGTVKRVDDLYVGVTEVDRKTLAPGFGSHIGQLFEDLAKEQKDSWWMQSEARTEIGPVIDKLLARL